MGRSASSPNSAVKPPQGPCSRTAQRGSSRSNRRASVKPSRMPRDRPLRGLTSNVMNTGTSIRQRLPGEALGPPERESGRRRRTSSARPAASAGPAAGTRSAARGRCRCRGAGPVRRQGWPAGTSTTPVDDVTATASGGPLDAGDRRTQPDPGRPSSSAIRAAIWWSCPRRSGPAARYRRRASIRSSPPEVFDVAHGVQHRDLVGLGAPGHPRHDRHQVPRAADALIDLSQPPRLTASSFSACGDVPRFGDARPRFAMRVRTATARGRCRPGRAARVSGSFPGSGAPCRASGIRLTRRCRWGWCSQPRSAASLSTAS